MPNFEQLLSYVTGGYLCGDCVCGSSPAAFGRCEHLVFFPLVCLSLGCPLGWPAGVSSILCMGEQPPSVWRIRESHSLGPCSRLLGRLPSDEIPSVSPLGCALLAVRACLLVLLCRAHPTNCITRYLPHPAYPAVVPRVRHRSSVLSCV
jgi:hypothetical protein